MTEEEMIILRNLQHNEDFTRKVIPFLKEEYFTDDVGKNYFKTIEEFFGKYNSLPTKEAVEIEFSNIKATEQTYKGLLETSENVEQLKDKKDNITWLVKTAEDFCKNRSLYLALMEAVSIADGQNNLLTTTSIPDILSKALAVSFDSAICHDYLDDMEERYKIYTTAIAKVPFRLDTFNKMTNGGAERKTLNVVAAPTGEGKSILLCQMAADYMRTGQNVLYITLELAEWKIGQRIDANLMNISLDDISTIPPAIWDQKSAQVRSMCVGKLKIREYGNGTASAANFRFLLQEIKQKNNFVPDVIIIDYIGICASSRVKDRGNTYAYGKSVAEELRSLMVENNVVGWSAVQVNRSGYNNSEIDITNTAESMGGPNTFDFMVVLIASEELDQLGQVMIKQLKNRYNDKRKDSCVVMGLDRAKMKFFDLNNTQIQQSQQQTSPVPTVQKKQTNQQPNKFKGVKV